LPALCGAAIHQIQILTDISGPPHLLMP
jgi:hypothetical protein